MRIRELDSVRALAAIMVMTHHLLPWQQYWFFAFGAWGGLGVDLFFVLSGYLITSILLQLRVQPNYFSTFYLRRSFRIFPVYYLALGIYFVASILSGWWGTWLGWAQYFLYFRSLLINDGFGSSLHTIPLIIAVGLGVLWSLSVEEIYYILWAPLVRFTSRRIFLATLVTIILGAPLLRWWLYDPTSGEYIRAWFFTKIDGLALGSVVALLAEARHNNRSSWARWERFWNWLTLALLAFYVSCGFALRGMNAKKIVYGPMMSVASVFFALLVFALIRNAGSNAIWVRIFRINWLRRVGMVSYSLYVFHYPIYFLVHHAIDRITQPGLPSEMLSTTISLALSLCLSFALWFGLESPLLRMKDRLVPSKAHVSTE